MMAMWRASGTATAKLGKFVFLEFGQGHGLSQTDRLKSLDLPAKVRRQPRYETTHQ